jgi:hypothetical protein
VGPRQRGYESSVGAGVGAGEVGAYGREHVGEAVRGGVEGGGLREDGWTRARGQARGDRAASADAAARGHTDAAVPDLRTSRRAVVWRSSFVRPLYRVGLKVWQGPQASFERELHAQGLSEFPSTAGRGRPALDGRSAIVLVRETIGAGSVHLLPPLPLFPLLLRIQNRKWHI